jgi:cell division protease FtsH
MNQFSRSIALWLALGLMFLLLFNMFSRQQVKEPEEIFSDFLNQVEKGQVSKVTIQGSTIHLVVNGEHYKTYAPADPDLVKTLRAKNIQIEAKPSEGDCWSGYGFSSCARCRSGAARRCPSARAAPSC